MDDHPHYEGEVIHCIPGKSLSATDIQKRLTGENLDSSYKMSYDSSQDTVRDCVEETLSNTATLILLCFILREFLNVYTVNTQFCLCKSDLPKQSPQATASS